jgi:transposase
VIEPLLPAPKHLGRPRGTDLRAVVDAILYMARTGCRWRLLPKDFPRSAPDLTVARLPPQSSCFSSRLTQCRLPKG